MNNQRSGCLSSALIVCLILLVLSVVLNLILAVGKTASMGGSFVSEELPKFDETLLVPPAQKENKPDKIAVIYLRGLITGMEPGAMGDTMVDDIKLQLKQA